MGMTVNTEQQLSLIFTAAPPRFPRTRRRDPRSSHEAAALVEATGLDRAQAEQVLAVLRAHPGSTSHELAVHGGLDRYAIARRLSELERTNKVRKLERTDTTPPCAISGKRVLRWEPV